MIKEKQWYRENDISLEKLAEISGISRHYLSETLNVFAKKSFYQYVNEYRIEEVIKALDSNRGGDSPLSIAYKSGFNKKSSFNTYFKNIISLIPCEYIRKHKRPFDKLIPRVFVLFVWSYTVLSVY